MSKNDELIAQARAFDLHLRARDFLKILLDKAETWQKLEVPGDLDLPQEALRMVEAIAEEGLHEQLADALEAAEQTLRSPRTEDEETISEQAVRIAELEALVADYRQRLQDAYDADNKKNDALRDSLRALRTENAALRKVVEAAKDAAQEMERVGAFDYVDDDLDVQAAVDDMRVAQQKLDDVLAALDQKGESDGDTE